MNTQTVKRTDLQLEQAVATYLMFSCLDMFEDFFATARKYENANRELDRAAKQRMYMIDEQWKQMKKYVRKTGMETQLNFGDTAEMFKELMVLLVDAGDEKPEVIKLVSDFASKFEPQLKLNKKAFGI